MSTLPKTGDKFVYDGLIVEAQESECTCSGCFFMYEDEVVCNRTCHSNDLPICHDSETNKYIIYKYVREATDEEIRKGVVDV